MKTDRVEKAQAALDNLLSCDTAALKELMRKHKIYEEGLFSFAKFKKGDRVIITGSIYGNPDHGTYRSTRAMMKGTSGVVDSVDWHEYRKSDGGYFCCMFQPDMESWVSSRPPWGNSGELGELGIEYLNLNLNVDRHLFFMHERDLTIQPEGYDTSVHVECRSCGWRGDHRELESRPPEGYSHLRLWCVQEGCTNHDGGYPEDRGFTVLSSPASRWLETKDE